jgi:hypothetical protein
VVLISGVGWTIFMSVVFFLQFANLGTFFTSHAIVAIGLIAGKAHLALISGHKCEAAR